MAAEVRKCPLVVKMASSSSSSSSLVILGLVMILALDLASAMVLEHTTAYLEDTLRRMVIYRDPAHECLILGQQSEIQRLLARNTTFSKVVTLPRREISRVIQHCNNIHSYLVSRYPSNVLGSDDILQDGPEETTVMRDAWDRRQDMGDQNLVFYQPPKRRKKKPKKNSLFNLEMFNRIFIFPGTKWCGRGDVAEHWEDLGYHSDVDKCCR